MNDPHLWAALVLAVITVGRWVISIGNFIEAPNDA